MTSSTTAPTTPTKAELMDLFAVIGTAYFRDFAAVASRHGLTSVQAKALAAVLREPLPMRRLAELLACDASNVTGIVDRLEARGLIRREVSASDRRVKNVVATEAGREAVYDVRAEMQATHAALDDLSQGEREALYTLLTRMRPALEAQG
jgi:DNA-binding MarR family transcriptional regulator